MCMSVNICFIDLSMLRGTCYSMLEPTKPVILAVSFYAVSISLAMAFNASFLYSRQVML